MKKLSLLFCLIYTSLILSCSNHKSSNHNLNDTDSLSQTKSENQVKTNQNCNCNSVEDCLDKNNFECAREFCSKDKYKCDKKQIIEIESLFWINQKSYSRSKKIALEIYSLEDMSKIDMNNWFSEKLDDIINAMINDGKVAEAELMATDFPVEIDGDNTYKFKLDALNTIAEGYAKSNMKREQKILQGKIIDMQRVKDEAKKQRIIQLQNDLTQLQKDQKVESKNIQKEIGELQTNLKEEKKRLESIRKDFYIIPGRRDDDIKSQTRVINEIELKIENLKNDLEQGKNEQINAVKDEINKLKSRN